LALLITAVLLGTFVLAGILFGWFGKLFSGQGDGQGRPPLMVSREVRGASRTISEALQKAQAGDRIVLFDSEYRERIRLEGSRYTAVHIEAAEGTAVAWLPPAVSRDDSTPLLLLAGVKGVRVKGIHFNGENRLQRLITLMGECPGAGLEEVSLEGFKKNGLTVWNCTGEPDHPVELLGLTDRPPAKELKDTPDAAVLFSAKDSAYFDVRDCRFTGKYAKGAVWFNHPRRADVKFTNMTPPIP
jgi:hypothetical protein